MASSSELKAELDALRRKVTDLETESRANAGVLATAIRRTRQQVVANELRQSVEKLKPPTSLLDWSPRKGDPTSPALQDSLIDRLRRGDPVADTIGNAEPVIGQTNLLRNPLLQGSGGVTVSGATQTQPDWLADYTVNSGVAPVVTVDDLFERGDPDNNPFNSAIMGLDFSPVASVYDIDAYIYPETTFNPVNVGLLPFLVGSVRVSTIGVATPAAYATARVRVELYRTSGTPGLVSSSEWLDINELEDADLGAGTYRHLVATADEFEGAIRWQLHVNVVKDTADVVGMSLFYGEPALHFAYSPDPVPFAPAVGTWIPDELAYKQSEDTEHRVRLYSQGLLFGPGDALEDVQLRRSAAGVLQLRRPNGAGGLIAELEGQTTSPGAATADHGRLWWNPDTDSFWFTTDAGLDVNMSRHRGIVAVPFAFTTALAGTGTVFIPWVDAAAGGANQRAPFAGSVVGISLAVSSNRVTGTLTAQVDNGSTGPTTYATPAALLDATTTNNDVATENVGVSTFSATHLLRVKLTTSGWTPTAITGTVIVYLAFDGAG